MGFFRVSIYGLKIRLIFSTNMKTYLGHVYQPKEEIPTQLTDFKKSLDQYSSTMEDADVHIVYVGPGTELTPEYEWIKDNAKNVVVIVQSNKYRRFAPKDFTWQECISLKRDKDVSAMLQKLNATEWIGSVSREDKEKMREAKRIERDARKLIRTREKLEKNKRKMEKTAMKVMDLSDSEVVIPVPEGKNNLRIKLILSWD